jgi:hypothetical protein
MIGDRSISKLVDSCCHKKYFVIFGQFSLFCRFKYLVRVTVCKLKQVRDLACFSISSCIVFTALDWSIGKLFIYTLYSINLSTLEMDHNDP